MVVCLTNFSIMRIGIIAEGFAGANVIKAIVKKLMGFDGADLRVLRPEEAFDETDLQAMNFSNWQLVFESCKDAVFMGAFFDSLEGDAMLILHVDTAERGLDGYDVNEPRRTKGVDYPTYAEQLRKNVIEKVNALVAEPYRDRIAYAIAVEETDAWLIPLFENAQSDTASHARAKERLAALIGSDKKRVKRYVDTAQKSLDYVRLGAQLAKDLNNCRKRNRSLDLFCMDIESRNQVNE